MGHIKDFIAQLEIGAPLVSGRLTMLPLLSDRTVRARYLTLDEALAAGVARVEEVSETGSVPELLFRNSGSKPILLLDGEELVGAKQNRVLNLSILVPAGTETKIPVSCVEAHRWGYRSRHFQSSDRAFHARGRAEKVGQVSAAMAAAAPPRPNQGSVWNEIARTARNLGVRSPTAAMGDIFEQHRPDIDHHVGCLVPQPQQVGAIFLIDGRAIGLDLFDAASTYAKLSPKLVRSYALGTLEDGPRAVDRRGPDNGAERLLRELQEAKMQRFPAIGLGEDWRLHGDSVQGAALVNDASVVHVCAFERETARAGSV